MCTTNDHVHINDIDNRSPAAVTLEPHLPQASIIVWSIASANKPVDESTWIILPTVMEGEEEKNASNNHAKKARLIPVQFNEDSITAETTTEAGCYGYCPITSRRAYEFCVCSAGASWEYLSVLHSRCFLGDSTEGGDWCFRSQRIRASLSDALWL